MAATHDDKDDNDRVKGNWVGIYTGGKPAVRMVLGLCLGVVWMVD